VSPRTYVVAMCGGGDRPIATLRGRTAFEAARTPHMDAMARAGTLGLLTVISADITPESDSGAMALLGYDPLVYYTGRGPLEGLGMGFWDPGGASVAFRVNFASRDPDTGRLDRRTSRDLTDDQLAVLAEQIQTRVTLSSCPGIRYQITAFGRHRGIVCFTSRDVSLSGNVSNTDPGFRKVGAFGVPNGTYVPQPLPCLALDGSDGARATAAAVNAFVAESAQVLQSSEVNRCRKEAGRLPANLLLFRDGGHTLPSLPDFTASYGQRMALYGQVPAERGLCLLAGGRFVSSRPARGQDYPAFYAELVTHITADPADLVFVHLKGPDEPGHDGQAAAKVAAIEGIDEHFVARLLERLRPADRLVLTCDHATPCELGIHSADPVPTLLYGAGIAANGGTRFCEREAATLEFPVSQASELLPRLLRTDAGVGGRP
jgi:2,3-bisphosphoglycerate-independent phosphoglycerate mutase